MRFGKTEQLVTGSEQVQVITRIVHGLRYSYWDIKKSFVATNGQKQGTLYLLGHKI